MSGSARRQLADVCLSITDGTHYSPATSAQGYPYITVRDLNEGRIDFVECKFVSASDYADLKRNGCAPSRGDVLFSKDGTVGKVALVNTDEEFVVLSSLAILRPNPSMIDPRFLAYSLQSPEFLTEALGRKTGVAIRRVILKNLKSMVLTVPPLEEQRRIVTMLDEAFAAIATAIANVEKNLTNAKELFEQAIKDTISGGEAEWAAAPFEECLDPIKYPAKVQRKTFLAEGAFPIISQEVAFINGYWDRPQDLLRVPRPLVVFGDHTRVLKYVDFDFVLGADGVKLLLPKPTISAKFLYYFLKANLVPSAGYARHYRHLKSLTIRYPPLAEQHVITDRLDEIGSGIEGLEGVYRSKLEALFHLRQSLLHGAFSGELNGREILAA